MKWTLVLNLGLGTAGIILAARALLGPFDFPVAVHSPINAEGWFTVAAALLVMLRLRSSSARSDADSDPLAREPFRAGAPNDGTRQNAWALLSFVVLITAAFVGSVHDYFLADDFILLRYAREFVFDVHRLLATGGGDGFFRPVTNLFFGLSFRWAGLNPVRWHVEGLVLHAVNVALVFALVRQTGSTRTSAWFAAALFAIHGTRPEAVVWTGGRFDLLAGFFVLLSIVLFLRFMDSTGRLRRIYWSASLAAMVLGILSKESAYAGPPILALMAAMRQFTREGAPLRPHWRRLAIPLAPFFAAAACLFAYRWVLFGGIGGYLDATGRPQALLLTPVSIIKTLAFRIWAVLTFPLDWDAIPQSGRSVLGVAVVAYLAALAWLTTAHARRRDLIAPLGFVLLASIPPLQQLLIGPGLDKARFLYLPAVGFCWLLAAVAAGLAQTQRRVVCAVILIFNVVALEYNLSAWRHVAALSRPACIAAASCAREHGNRLLAIGLPRWINGAYLFPLGFPDCTRIELTRLLDTPDAAPLEVTMRDAPPTAEEAASDFCVLTWDPATEQLRQGPK